MGTLLCELNDNGTSSLGSNLAERPMSALSSDETRKSSVATLSG